jgi:hypothetical protein
MSLNPDAQKTRCTDWKWTTLSSGLVLNVQFHIEMNMDVDSLNEFCSLVHLKQNCINFCCKSVFIICFNFPLKSEKHSAVSFPSCHTTKHTQKWLPPLPPPPGVIENEKQTLQPSFIQTLVLQTSSTRGGSSSMSYNPLAKVTEAQGFSSPGAGSSELNTTFCGLWVCMGGGGGLLWPILLPTW